MKYFFMGLSFMVIVWACPDQKLCAEITPYLAPIQMGEKETGEILMVTKEESDMYFAAEDQAVTMAECQMM